MSDAPTGREALRGSRAAPTRSGSHRSREYTAIRPWSDAIR